MPNPPPRNPHEPQPPYGPMPAAGAPRRGGKLPYILAGVGVMVVLCLGGVAIGLAAGNSAPDSSANGTAETKVAQDATAPAGPAETTPSPAAETTKPAASPTKKAAIVATPTPTSVRKIKVPNGVGLNYQEAQDRWRAAGLHVAPAEDATGAHRLPVLDRNWVVVSQDLKAGSKVAPDSFITATVKKYSDD